MPYLTPVDGPIEREFGSLLRKLEAVRGFCLVFYFVEDARPVSQIRSRLASELEVRGRRLVVVSARVASALVTTTLGGIFDAASSTLEPGGRPVVWAEAFRNNGDYDWDGQRRLLLMRMNERRSRFEADSAVPLVLLLPAGFQREAASLAPDLWHVRLHSATLSMAASEAPAPARRSAEQPVRAGDGSPGRPPAVAYWNALFEGAGDDVEALDALSIKDGFDALHAWQGQHEAYSAVELAERLVRMARDRLGRSDGDSRTERRRDLTVALREWGDSALQVGQLDAALAVLDEGLSLITVDDDTLLVDRDAALRSSLLLSRGAVLLTAGRAREALSTYEDSLAALRRLPTDPRFSGPWDVLELLDRIGDAALRAGDPQTAVAAFSESVSLYRGLLALHLDDGSLRRTLASALVQLGDAEWRQGRGERALGAYREGLANMREAAYRGSGAQLDVPELGLLWMRVGSVEQAIGRDDAAVAAYETVLELDRRRLARDGLLGQLLNELAGSLETIVNAHAGGVPDPVERSTAVRLLAIVRQLQAAPESALADKDQSPL